MPLYADCICVGSPAEPLRPSYAAKSRQEMQSVALFLLDKEINGTRLAFGFDRERRDDRQLKTFYCV